ncbi:MAG: hypothetical protein WCZ18_05945 [Ottowia sp.]|nr:hypothetical protein [Ottowia sp.]
MSRQGSLSRRRWLAAGLSACVLPLALAACSQDDADARLRLRIEDMRDAIGDRKPRAFMAGVAPDFIGTDGLDHDGVQQLLRLHMLRNAKIGITLGPLSVEREGAQARVVFKAMLSGGDGAGWPDAIRGWTVHSGWRDGDAGWQLLQASWKPVY